MKVRVFTIPFDLNAYAFDDSELQSFLQDHSATSITEHAFQVHGTPVLALVVRYEDATAPKARRKQPDPRPQDALSSADRTLFETLRKWRNKTSKKEGRPAYVMFTNAQLADVARTRPQTLAALKRIKGIGDARVKRYGQQVLGLVEAVQPGASTSDDG